MPHGDLRPQRSFCFGGFILEMAVLKVSWCGLSSDNQCTDVFNSQVSEPQKVVEHVIYVNGYVNVLSRHVCTYV